MRYRFFSISSVLFVYCLVIYFYKNNVAICKHSILPGFEDLRYVIRFIDFYQNGDDIYGSNIYHKPYVYPRFSIILFSFFTFSFVSINTLSILLIIYFICMFYLIFDIKGKKDSILYTSFLISPAILLLFERMNIDVIILLALLTIIFFRKRFINRKIIYLFYSTVCILSLVKIYPIILLAILPFEDNLTKKEKVQLFIFSTIIFSSVNLYFIEDYLIMLKNIPQPSELAFGRFVLFNEYLNGITLKISSFFPFVLGLIFFYIRKSSYLSPFANEVKLTNTFLMFLIGGSIYSFSYILSNNYDYRLVFLILTLPYILQNFQNQNQLKFFFISVILVLYTSALHLYVLPFQNYFQWVIGRNVCMIIKYFASTYLACYFVSIYMNLIFCKFRHNVILLKIFC
jgi:hypothetical protein